MLVQQHRPTATQFSSYVLQCRSTFSNQTSVVGSCAVIVLPCSKSVSRPSVLPKSQHAAAKTLQADITARNFLGGDDDDDDDDDNE